MYHHEEAVKRVLWIFALFSWFCLGVPLSFSVTTFPFPALQFAEHSVLGWCKIKKEEKWIRI
jgi:hypothetical protein